MKRRILSFFIALALCLSLVPMEALAADGACAHDSIVFAKEESGNDHAYTLKCQNCGQTLSLAQLMVRSAGGKDVDNVNLFYGEGCTLSVEDGFSSSVRPIGFPTYIYKWKAASEGEGDQNQPAPPESTYSYCDLPTNLKPGMYRYTCTVSLPEGCTLNGKDSEESKAVLDFTVKVTKRPVHVTITSEDIDTAQNPVPVYVGMPITFTVEVEKGPENYVPALYYGYTNIHNDAVTGVMPRPEDTYWGLKYSFKVPGDAQGPITISAGAKESEEGLYDFTNSPTIELAMKDGQYIQIEAVPEANADKMYNGKPHPGYSSYTAKDPDGNDYKGPLEFKYFKAEDYDYSNPLEGPPIDAGHYNLVIKPENESHHGQAVVPFDINQALGPQLSLSAEPSLATPGEKVTLKVTRAPGVTGGTITVEADGNTLTCVPSVSEENTWTVTLPDIINSNTAYYGFTAKWQAGDGDPNHGDSYAYCAVFVGGNNIERITLNENMESYTYGNNANFITVTTNGGTGITGDFSFTFPGGGSNDPRSVKFTNANLTVGGTLNIAGDNRTTLELDHTQLVVGTVSAGGSGHANGRVRIGAGSSLTATNGMSIDSLEVVGGGHLELTNTFSAGLLNISGAALNDPNDVSDVHVKTEHGTPALAMMVTGEGQVENQELQNQFEQQVQTYMNVGDCVFGIYDNTYTLLEYAGGPPVTEITLRADGAGTPLLKHVKSVTLDRDNIEPFVGTKDTLSATVEKPHRFDERVTITTTWTSLNPDIATVDKEGTVTAKAVGVATIRFTASTCTTEGHDQWKECTVTVKAKPVSVTGVTVTPPTCELEVGGSQQLTAAVVPDDAADKTVTWTSSDVSVATVDENGKVTAIAGGTTVITATAVGDVTGNCTITVKVKVTGITIDRTACTLKVGGNQQLTAAVKPDNATNQTVTWSSSDTSVATVDENGNVTAVAKGTADITATTVDGGFTATCTVTVEEAIIDVTGVTVEPTTCELEVGATIDLKATVTPDNATNQMVTWKSSDASVATVDVNGNVRAVAEGTAFITATAVGEKSATCTVIVKTKTIGVIGVTIEPTTCKLEVGATKDLEATVAPVDATDKTVTWSSNEPSIATVDQTTGKVKAVAVGTATITATTVDGSFTATCTVTVTEPPVPTPVTDVTVMPDKLSLNVGETGNLEATVKPDDATNQTVTWSSNEPSIATVDQTGKVTAIAEGTATITATAVGGKSATCTVTVVPTTVIPPITPTWPSDYVHVMMYIITVTDSQYGRVKASRTSAVPGTKIMLTVTPDDGYELSELTVANTWGSLVPLTEEHAFTMPNSDVTVRAVFTPVLEAPCDGGVDCPSRAYIDLDIGAWYHEAVDYVIRAKLLTGSGNGVFGPEEHLTRAMLVQVLYNVEGRPIVNGGGFADVAPGSWYADAVAWAASQNIVVGYGDGIFRPNGKITREQLAVMLWRYAGNPAATEKELHFADAALASSWALDALRWAVESGVLQGSDGLLNPQGLATRAQTAQMLKNFLKGR